MCAASCANLMHAHSRALKLLQKWHWTRLTVYEHMQGSRSQHPAVVPQLSRPQLEQGLISSASSIWLQVQAGLSSD